MTKILTIHILTLNNSTTIDSTISSLSNLNADIYVGDLGSKDNTTDICSAKGCRVFNASNAQDMSVLRNRMVSHSNTEWQMVLEPWEIITDNDSIQQIINSSQVSAYQFNVLQNDMLTKEIRLWHRGCKAKFRNPAFEYLDIQESLVQPTQIYIFDPGSGNRRYQFDIVNQWRKEHPTSKTACYYESCCHLAKRNWKEFITSANRFLFNNNKADMSSIMIKHYLSGVYCHVLKDMSNAVRYALSCVAAKPTMAEFWCDLGDAYYYLAHDYKKAIPFYKNGMALGSRRLSTDSWPMQISKYQDYPSKMIDSCEKLLQNNENLFSIMN